MPWRYPGPATTLPRLAPTWNDEANQASISSVWKAGFDGKARALLKPLAVPLVAGAEQVIGARSFVELVHAVRCWRRQQASLCHP